MTISPKAIRPATLALLKTLMRDERLTGFTLVGGTALAIHYQHRLSIDLDLFGPEEFDSAALDEYLAVTYDWRVSKVGPNLLMGFVDDIKVDLLRHNYEWLYRVEDRDGIRLASALDIAAMKINAIAHSGQRQKDFYDVYTLLEHYSLDEIAEAYAAKYRNSNKLIGLRSVSYFGDIDFEREPALMVHDVDFEDVRQRLTAAVIDPYRVFP